MMKKVLLILGLVVAAFLVYKFAFKKAEAPHEAPKPLTVSKHSGAFNESVGEILKSYFAMTDGFVNWDSNAVNKNALSLQKAIHNFRAEDLKKDTAIYQTVIFPWDNAKNNVIAILSSSGWPEKRRALQDLSENLRMLLITVKYDRAVTYWQECPMAFGEGSSGNWLSSKEQVVNPYLGNKDPQYGNTMINCGETKMAIDFTKTDSTSVH